MGHLLEVKHLCSDFRTGEGVVKAAENVSFYLDKGEIIGIVGESGSGKSVTQLSILQLLSEPGKITGGEVLLNGVNILEYPEDGSQMRNIRGGDIGMIFQEPMTSLNPVLTVGYQLCESIMLHLNVGRREASGRAIELLKKMGIADAEKSFHRYPDEFSGGMRQRIMIAMAMSANPGILIADEATTALDVTTQAQILDLLSGIVKETKTALILVTHNIGIVAEYADRIYVMYAGCMLESGKASQVLERPGHPYTRRLLQAIPRLTDLPDRVLLPIEGGLPDMADKPETCVFQPRCPYSEASCLEKGRPCMYEVEAGHLAACRLHQKSLDLIEEELRASVPKRQPRTSIRTNKILEVNNLNKWFEAGNGFLHHKRKIHVLKGVSFYIREGETLGIVGESGCGKTTLARTLMRLYEPDQGTIVFDGQDITHEKEKKLNNLRKFMSMVFQDSYSSMNPRSNARAEVEEPMIIHGAKRGNALESSIDSRFRLVGLDPLLKYRAAHELSGGQRQRINIARALSGGPKLVICDEPVSALDISVQAQIINLLEELQEKLGLTYLFIAHDLAVVKHISDRILVMYAGTVVEISECEELYHNALHPYTRLLLSAIPTGEKREKKGRVSNQPVNHIVPIESQFTGCPFCTRCFEAADKCSKSAPQLIDTGGGHYVACHLQFSKEESGC